jgi:succinate dehydrogenase/fumarate reductase flavoprotein subunit
MASDPALERVAVEWPYEIDYAKINIIESDVLVVGGGIAGSWAAITAAKRGVKVVVVEEADAFSAGPAGCDHWVYALDNPCCKLTPEELIEANDLSYYGYLNGIAHYIHYKEGYSTLLELEKMGGKVRDTEDEFKGAPFRDEETKLLFAYDYDTKHTIRVWGQTFRPALYAELRRRRVDLYNRVMVTRLLTEAEGQNKVVGATGVNVRTGEFYVFRARATILCLGRTYQDRTWCYNGYRFVPGLRPPSMAGTGFVIAWKAGAKLTLMEGRAAGRIVFQPFYGAGNPYNTWYPCSMVDAKGRAIPYVDKDGKTLSFEQRVHPSLLGQRLFLERILNPEIPYNQPLSLSDTPHFEELVRKGEYTLPIYADLPSMPEHERRAIFGLMVGNEGQSWIVYRNLTQAGFDPDKDLLQAYRTRNRQLDQTARGYTLLYGGLVHDWDFKTSVEGLYAAGDVLFGLNYHGHAATSGRWAGAKAADYAKKATEPQVDERQVESERERVYSPTKRKDGIYWKELNTGISSVMRTYASDIITDEMLNIAMAWLGELREKEGQELVARNPHELARSLETLDVLSVAEIWVQSAFARKASLALGDFRRQDHQDVDPLEWDKFITLRNNQGRVEVGDLPLRYWLEPPFASTYRDNYEKHRPW